MAMNQTLTLQRSQAAFGRQRIKLLYHNEHSGNKLWDAQENMRESVLAQGGQFISLDVAASETESLPDVFYAALKNARWEHSLSFSLPAILQHNPHVASPFINHAILWQRLCDLLIIDDEPGRPTVLVLENIDQASPAVQHETARLIRFHMAHSVRRTFVFTLDRHLFDHIIPELRDMINR